MLWSQIKLTLYDFIDVHITNEFDNRPWCVVTYRTGAGRRLYMITSAADADAGFLHEFLRVMMKTYKYI